MSVVKARARDTSFILSLVVFSFISFISIGIPLAALPGYLHQVLGFSTLAAWIGLQNIFLGAALVAAASLVIVWLLHVQQRRGC